MDTPCVFHLGELPGEELLGGRLCAYSASVDFSKEFYNVIPVITFSDPTLKIV